MKKVGIFAGTFDPVHSGHISFAREATKQCKLDKVFFLVEPRPRRKQGVKAFEHRTAMLQLALEPESKFGMIVLDQARFSVSETLPKLLERFKGAQLYMLVGEDVLMHMASWPHIDELIGAVHFVIGIRKRSVEELTKHIELLEKTRGLTFQYIIFSAENTTVSSSAVRQKLRAGKSSGDIHNAVQAYIKKEKLYASSEE